MKRDFCSICKRTALALLGAAMLYLLSACTSNSNDNDAIHEPEGSAVKNLKGDESGNVDQPSEVSTGQPQISPDVSSEQSQVSLDVSSEKPQVSIDENSEQSNNVSEGKDENSMFSIGETYKAILLGNDDFISTDLQNRELSLKDISEAVTDDDSVTVKVSKFTIIDLDGDGENEVVLWIQINGVVDYGFEILHFQDGEVYGYTLPYRTFFNLKTDGTFTFSDSAADSGIGKLRFSVDGYAIEDIIGEAYLEEEINAAINQQDAKKDVDWYDLSVDSVNIVLKEMF